MTEIPEIIAKLEACKSKDWHLDEVVNNTIGKVRAVGVIGLRGRGKQMRYFGPKSDPLGRGSSVPSPTKTPESRSKAIIALRRLAEQKEEAS